MTARTVTAWRCPRQGCDNRITLRTLTATPNPPTCDGPSHTAVLMKLTEPGDNPS